MSLERCNSQYAETEFCHRLLCRESKPCEDHFASFVTSSQILFNPVRTGPLGFFKSLTVGLEAGGLWRSASRSLEVLHSRQTMKLRGFVTHSKLLLPGL